MAGGTEVGAPCSSYMILLLGNMTASGFYSKRCGAQPQQLLAERLETSGSCLGHIYTVRQTAFLESLMSNFITGNHLEWSWTGRGGALGGSAATGEARGAASHTLACRTIYLFHTNTLRPRTSCMRLHARLQQVAN